MDSCQNLGKLRRFALVCALCAGVVPAFAQNLNPQTSTMPSATASPYPPTPKTTPNTPKPTLIVWARTDIPNQGAPTLDLLDVERHVVNQLIARQMANVLSLQTTKIPREPAPNMYLGELAVDAMQLAQRPVWNDQQKQNVLDTVFGADVSLTVKHLKTGKVLGTVRGRAEHHYDPWWTERDITEKRVAIYAAANILAARFVAEANEGVLGAEVKSLLPSPPKVTAKPSDAPSAQPPWAPLELWQFAAIIGVFSIVVFIWLASYVARNARPGMSPNNPRSPRPRPEEPIERPWGRLGDEWDERLNQALALSLATDNFSDAACREAARQEHARILECRKAIEKVEAERRLNAKTRATEDLKIAAYGASRSNFGRDALIEILGKADEWPYRVLREAMTPTEREVV
jgi:hypothetical protein